MAGDLRVYDRRGLDAVLFAYSSAGLDQVALRRATSAHGVFKRACGLLGLADYDKVGVDEPCVKAYVADVRRASRSLRRSRRNCAPAETDLGYDAGSLAVVVRQMDDADWENNWKAYYKPLKIGKRLDVLALLVDRTRAGRPRHAQTRPRVALGTGEHHHADVPRAA